MNIDDYEKKYAVIYAEFANTVRRIIEQAIEHTEGAPLPQSIQARAKAPDRLRARLEEVGKLESETIEIDRKDLAGIRLIFYTNTDVDVFLKSRLIFGNFDVDMQATKIHHPSKETDGNRYQGIHYTVRLTEDRTKLPEYARFVGLRCEIQIQTILNHSWSETSHDIIYKDHLGDGFGTEARESIKKRFNDIMDKYLLPAGYEFQRIQHDYNRLQQGKKLFDRDAVQSLLAAKDNNERYDLLVTLRDFTIPHYDDLPGIYEDLRGPLIEVVKAARATPTVPIDATFGQLVGHPAKHVVNLVVEIFGRLRYVNAIGSFEALCDIFRDEPDADIRKKIQETVKQLAEYNLDVWKQVGPSIQIALVEHIESLSPEDQFILKPIIMEVWREVLQSDITGTSWSGDTVTFRTGSVPASETLEKLRTQVIDALFLAFDRADSETEQREILLVLDVATSTGPGHASDELLALCLIDAKRVVNFLTERVTHLPYEILETLEERFLWDYRRAKGMIAAEPGKFACVDQAKALIASIENFRDQVNQDDSFVKYKTLVGFETVFPQHWTDEDFDYSEAEAYRSKQSEAFINQIDAQNENDWLKFIERCAATKSNDLATFPNFGQFLYNLSKEKPEVVERYIENANDDLLQFLAGMLDGLAESSDETIYQRVLKSQVIRGTRLQSVARHFRNSKPKNPSMIEEVLAKAIMADDDFAVIECLLFSMQAPPEKVPAKEYLFYPALAFLTGKRDTRWIRGAWYKDAIKPFYATLSEKDANLLLDNLLNLPSINSQAERILGQIAENNLAAVWNYFGDRLRLEQEVKQDAENPKERYEAIPYELHGLKKQMSADARLAVSIGRQWHSDNNQLFRWRGGKLLSSAFPTCTEDFAAELIKLVNDGDGTDADFALDILQNYHGEPSTHEVLKVIIAKYPADKEKLSGVAIAFDNTGVVSGEDGWANALREKKELLKAWLGDDRAEIRTFAENHIRELDLNIISEQRRADERRELRRQRNENADDDTSDS